MSYDYSSETKQLELPNPFRVQNALMGLCGLVLIGGGLVGLWWGREAWVQARALAGALPILVGLGLLGAGVWAVARATTRLRYFFGRKRPSSLAPDLPLNAVGTSDEARRLQDLLRQGALEYPEPQGAIEGLLYNLVPHLITAPGPLQAMARRQFFNLTAMVATLLSFVAAWLLVTREEVRPWVALLYLVFGFVFLVRPVMTQTQARLTLSSLVGLVAGAVLGPVLLGWVAHPLPSLGSFSVAPQTTVMLLSGLVALGLVMLAVMAQVALPPMTRTSAQQLRMSVNVPPSLLMDELDRRFQETWTERIPNRRYARVEPLIDPARHAAPFAGELFEETQPMPMAGSTAPTLLAALRSKRHRWLAALDLYATMLSLLAVGFALYFVRHFNPEAGLWPPHAWLIGMAGILLLVALFCQHAAAELWGRFDFSSDLVWVEFAGTYQSATIGTGNALTARMSTQNQIVRIEAMTLRVWRAKIESVTFGKDAERRITAMFSTDPEAKELAEHLAGFGQAQSSFVAPGAQADVTRLEALTQAERMLHGAAEGAPAPLLDSKEVLQAAVGVAAEQAQSAPAARYCHACGTALVPGGRFCAGCGQPVEGRA